MKTNYIKKVFNTRDEWLNSRGIGGSDLASLFGKSKWQSIDDVYNRIALNIEKPKKVNDRMQEGIDTEDIVRKLFGATHKQFKVIAPPKNKHWQFIRKDYPLMTCTPDGIIQDLKTKKKYGIEIKNVELYKTQDKEMWENNILPEQYYFQNLQYMIVLNDLDGVILYPLLKHMKYEEEQKMFVLDRIEFKEYWMFREDLKKHIDYAEKKEIDFIKNNIEKLKRPQVEIKI